MEEQLISAAAARKRRKEARATREARRARPRGGGGRLGRLRETLGKWPLREIAFGLKCYLRQQGNLQHKYAGSNSVPLDGLVMPARGSGSARRWKGRLRRRRGGSWAATRGTGSPLGSSRRCPIPAADPLPCPKLKFSDGESETDSEESALRGSDGEGTSWISWFCGLRGNEFVCVVEDKYELLRKNFSDPGCFGFGIQEHLDLGIN